MKLTPYAALALGLFACKSAAPLPPEPPPSSGGATLATDADAGGAQAQIAADPIEDDGEWGLVGGPSFSHTVDKVVGMVGDPQLRQAVERRGLSLVNVMWEDTGRSQGSALGPNITDLTLQVRHRRPGQRAEEGALMPVIRFPNFSDRTGDVAADKFLLRVGNQRDTSKLHTVPLTEVLSNIKRFAAKPWTIEGDGNLLAERDSHFLVSAQAVFLPIPKTGKAEFNPVVFNYQSAPGSPAVLSILVTRQGTSMSVVENSPEDGSLSGWGQELYFNNQGQRAAFTAERKSDVQKRIAQQGGPKTADDRSALARGADTLFLIQVPLKHANRGFLGGMQMEAAEDDGAMAMPAPASGAVAERKRSDVEQAVLGHGRNRGPFNEGHGLKLERDPRFPIRITVQFYKATSNGEVSDADLDTISISIGGVYEHADFVGSLVIPNGDPLRPTAWNNMPRQWFPW